MDIIVGDMVKLISGDCGCETCLEAMGDFYEVTDVDDVVIETELGTFSNTYIWEVLNLALEND